MCDSDTAIEKGVITKAAEALRRGDLVAFPTETVYGLGADARNEDAVRRIFQVKGRPSSNPLIVHVASTSEIFRYADLSRSFAPKLLRARLEKLSPLWPGPLSVVLPRGQEIADAVSGGGTTVALRIPNHPLALALLRKFDGPVAAPSANISEYVSPTTAEHVRSGLGSKIACVLDGGPCSVGLESTVLSLIEETPLILRPGAITKDQLQATLETEVLRAPFAATESALKLSPGLLAKHYSPSTPVCFESALTELSPAPKKIGAIIFQPRELAFQATQIRLLSQHGHLEEVAMHLFAALRELDQMALDLIVVDTCEPIGLGEAIMDRLLRATK